MEKAFKDSRLKVERANKHISDLNDHISAYLAKGPYKVVVETDPESTANCIFVARVSEEFPCDVPAYIGDAVHNLRAALDLLATSLVVANGGSPDDVYWPFGRDADHFETRIKNTHIDRAAPDVVDMIRAMKPYNGGNESLRGLHDLDIADKHRALIPVANLVGIPDIITLNETGQPIGGFFGCQAGPLEDGICLMCITKPVNIEFGAELKPAINVTFGQGHPFRFKPVLETLHQLSKLVDGIVQTFASHIAGS